MNSHPLTMIDWFTKNQKGRAMEKGRGFLDCERAKKWRDLQSKNFSSNENSFVVMCVKDSWDEIQPQIVSCTFGFMYHSAIIWQTFVDGKGSKKYRVIIHFFQPKSIIIQSEWIESILFLFESNRENILNTHGACMWGKIRHAPVRSFEGLKLRRSFFEREIKK